MSNIGDQIRYARKAKGMTQEALAEALHMSRQGVSHWEAGRTMPDAATLLKLSDILEYTFKAEGFSEPEPVQTADASPAETFCQPEEEAAPPKKRRKRLRTMLIIAAALLVLAGGVMWLLILREKPAANVSMEILDTPLYLQEDPEHHLGYSWRFTLSMHNESDVPFKPEKITFLLLDGERIASKSFVTTDEMLPWLQAELESEYFHREDAPFEWNFQCSSDRIEDIDGVELILKGMDANGNELLFNVREPLCHEFKD